MDLNSLQINDGTSVTFKILFLECTLTLVSLSLRWALLWKVEYKRKCATLVITV